jgi:phage terminase large subunit-like protein
MLEHGRLADWISTGSTLTCLSTRGRMEALSSQGALQHGRAPTAALIDELGSFTTNKQNETYTALATGLHKRADAYLLATTTAGADTDSLLGRIYHQALDSGDVTTSRNGCLTIAKNTSAGTLLWWYGAPADADPENPKTIRACNPASWISIPDLQQQRRDPGLSEADFRRHHLNQWPTTTAPSRVASDATQLHRKPGTAEQYKELIRKIERNNRQNQSAAQELRPGEPASSAQPEEDSSTKDPAPKQRQEV